MKKRVLLIEDDACGIGWIQLQLGQRYQFTVATDSKSARSLLKEKSFDVVLLDLFLEHNYNTLAMLPEIKARCPVVIVVSNTYDDDLILDCVASGISGLVLKRQLDNELLHTIENACAGFSVFSKDLLARVAKQKAAPKLHLTARHKDILNQLARLPAPGNGEIALALGISEKTVANLVTELRQIFDAPSRNHIILLARQRGFQPMRAIEWIDAA